MKRIVLSILFLFITFISIAQEIIIGRVIKVADGDTITILTSEHRQIKVRLHGIDCPEKNQDFGTRAKQYTSELSFGKIVQVQVLDYDRYGRTIGIVTLPDSNILNKELLKAGLAWHYKHYDKSKEFADLETQARNQKIGVWSMNNAVAPWEFRHSAIKN